MAALLVNDGLTLLVSPQIQHVRAVTLARLKEWLSTSDRQVAGKRPNSTLHGRLAFALEWLFLPHSGYWANAGRIVSRAKPDAPGTDSGQRTGRSAHAKGLAKLGVSAPSASQCRGLAGAAPAPNSPGALANPVHFSILRTQAVYTLIAVTR
jgi:hypothetical protein